MELHRGAGSTALRSLAEKKRRAEAVVSSATVPLRHPGAVAAEPAGRLPSCRWSYPGTVRILSRVLLTFVHSTPYSPSPYVADI